jgi:putative membrane protein
VLHASAWLGPRAAVALLAGAAGLGLALEAVGVATGVPFGRYAYAATLGPQVLGVPLVVPLAWTMMAYPALLAARRLAGAGGGGRRLVTAVLGGWTLAAWDLFLDPQMVAAGHWAWAHPSPALPGVPTVPVGNTVGWLVVGTVMTALVDQLLPRVAAAPAAAEALPAALLLWTWLGSVVANLAFFGRPWVALLGGAAMGLVVVPYVETLTRASRRRHRQGLTG